VQAADTPGLEPVRVKLKLRRGTVVRGRLTDAVTGKPFAGSVRYAPLADNRFFDSGPGTNGYAFERYDAPTF
jgi:hypothetical protein